MSGCCGVLCSAAQKAAALRQGLLDRHPRVAAAAQVTISQLAFQKTHSY